MNNYSWEELLLESENDYYSISDFKKEIEQLDNKSTLIPNYDYSNYDLFREKNKKKLEFSEQIKKLSFQKVLKESDIDYFIENNDSIIENNNHKFPQSNSIETAVYTLNKIINEEKFINRPPSSSDLAKLYGFSERQGSYYGDFLVYLRFLEKNIYYYPTEKALVYKKSNEKDRIIMLVQSFLEHETIRKYYSLKKESKIYDIDSEKFIDILKQDSLMKNFSESTIKRRKSTVESIIKFIDNVTIPSPRPFIKWVGGKQKIILELLKRVPEEGRYSRYIEPFAGGSALLYRLKFKEAIINDINSELINTYQQVKDYPLKLSQLLESYENNEETFYRIREMDRDPDYHLKTTKLERAARFIYLNKTCFNGLYRVNSKGHFNTPFGRYKTDSYKNQELLEVDSEFFNLKDVQFLNTDFVEVLSLADENTFIYLDPPYDPISKTASFTGYSENGFGVEDQIRLKEECDKLTELGAKVMISNHNTPLIRKLFQNDPRYNFEIINVQRNIAAKSKSRIVVEEVVITNY